MGIVHLLKLCVGAEGPEDLAAWQKAHQSQWPKGVAIHTTRMWPKREADLLGGGSLYWVMKGIILCRQRLIGLERVEGADGISRCALVLDPEIIRTEAVPRRPFQGWRYLDAKDAPSDLQMTRAGEEDLPPALAQALAAIGVR